MARVLVIRLSALGDVAMLIPVLYSAADAYPEEEFVLLTKSPLLPIFNHRPHNVAIIPVFAKGEHKGLSGLWKLIRQLTSTKIDKVADVHNVLRSQQIRRYFALKRKKTATIDKGRKEKKELTRRDHKILKPLKTSIERYHDVFRQLGYDFDIRFRTIFDYGGRNFNLIRQVTGEKSGNWVGIAPFAKHKGKLFPLEKTEEVIRILSARPHTKIFLFGGKEEESHLENWASTYKNVTSVAGHFSFSSELLLMSYLDVMLTMDSGNMHLASLVNTPVISIWGATHPFAGFYGYGQNPEYTVQISDLTCRPCSVFGNKPCFRKDYACLEWITPGQIIESIEKILSGNENHH